MGGASLFISGQINFPRRLIEAPCLTRIFAQLSRNSYVVVKELKLLAKSRLTTMYKEVKTVANEGGFIYGQDDNPHAKPSKDKVVGKVDLPEKGEGVDNCNVNENVEYSDKIEGECE